MTLLITGATGGLGRFILHSLLRFNTPLSSFAASTRNPSNIPADLASTGIRFIKADFDEPSTLTPAFAGVTKLFLISTDSFDPIGRFESHKRAIDAAKHAGVGRIYYCSLAFGGFGDESEAVVMAAHLMTEKYLKGSGVDYTIIREGVYVDAFPFFLGWYPDTTEIVLPADGKVAWTSRDELAEGTARLLLEEGYRNEIVLLTAGEAITQEETAKVIAEVLGKNIDFRIGKEEEYVKFFVEHGGKPEGLANAWKSAYYSVAKGHTETVDPLLEKLLGRKPKTATEWLKETLGKNPDYRWHQNEGFRK